MRFFVHKSRFFKLIRLAALVLLIGLFAIGCDGAISRGWSGPLLNDGTVYVGTIKGDVIGFDNSTGDQKWEFTIGVIKGGGSSFACAGGSVSTAMSIYSTPAVDNGVIYVGGYDGIVYAIRINDKFERQFPTDGNIGAIVGSPVIANNTLFVGSSDGKLYAVSLDTWEEKWVFETEDKIWATPVVQDGVVYIGSSDHNLYVIDAESGQERWHFQAQGAILSTPLVTDSTVYIGSSDRKFYAIPIAQEGKEAQVFEGAGNWFWTQALAHDNVIYVGSLDHKLYALDANDITNKLDEFGTEGIITTPPVLVSGKIVIGSGDHYLYVLNPIGSESAKMVKTGDYDLGAPVLAPLGTDLENGIVYAHAQDGDHILYAIDVITGYLWEQKTSE